LPCDTQFALVELTKRKLQLQNPDEIVEMLRNARHSNEFDVRVMGLDSLMNFDDLLRMCPRPRDLKVTQALCIRLTYQDPNTISVKEDHEQSAYVSYESIVLNELNECVIAPKRNNYIQLNDNLIEDLRVSVEYIAPERRRYWDFL